MLRRCKMNGAIVTLWFENGCVLTPLWFWDWLNAD